MIELRHVEKAFPDVTPLKDVNATINRGDIIAVIGPSGIGKSQLLRCINMLGAPTKGQIFLDGEEITAKGCDVTAVRKKIGTVFQNFNLFPHLTVIENIMNPQIKLLGRSKKEAYGKAMNLLAKVGLVDRYAKFPDELSGGQKQRVAICRTLAMDPEVVLMDEPTSALDPAMVGEVEDVIRNLAAEGRTMVIVTHDMKLAQTICNRVFYMDEGCIYEEGTPEQIFGHPERERTRRFISGLSCLDIMVTPENHDLDAEIEKIHSFCTLKGLSARRIMNACGTYEESLNIIYRYYQRGEKTVHVTFEYDSAKDLLDCTIVSYRETGWSENESVVRDSLENRLITHYIRGYREEPTEEGGGVKYVYSL